MSVVWQSRNYDPADIMARYIGFKGDHLREYEVNGRGLTVKILDADPANYPEGKVTQARVFAHEVKI